MEWELGRRRRQVDAELAAPDFAAQVDAAVPVGSVGERSGFAIRAKPVVIVPGRAFLVGLRHRYSMGNVYPWKVAWHGVEPVLRTLAGELSLLEWQYKGRGGLNLDSDRDVAEWVVTQAVHEGIALGLPWLSPDAPFVVPVSR